MSPLTPALQTQLFLAAPDYMENSPDQTSAFYRGGVES